MTRTEQPLVLDDQLCFALYAASRAMTARYRPMLDELGLTYPQYLVLVVLWDEGESTVSTLGRRLRLDSGTLSPLLKRLERAGLITRSRGTDDERSVRVQVTPAGRSLRDRAAAIPPVIRDAFTDLDDTRLIGELRALEQALREN
ncbi:MarR family winged helix-turn-helix transcriptional regulator [Jatrophihabitans endophyticus]|uniref:MarR family winged helix-turn-helix transcriptional regulator n=1 Tax=Jatrophihabitans endophyticus TaxID=1206085 RepID=UPI0019F7D422|nr:MarR family transcriptional regulator [Jatrophihabitans endophyticus]MBE7187072.1 MarR family transcriptional regulator [Jatrophihabitans endophyticus]